MQDTFARAHTRPSARATIGYLVYKDDIVGQGSTVIVDQQYARAG